VQVKKLLVRIVRPEAAATAFSFLLPDLIDKPLWVLGVFSDGRNIGHTLLLVSLVALAFSLKKRVYGLFALCGGISHLLLDTSGYIPWFYPFKGYDFPTVDYREIVTFANVVETLVEMAFVVVVVSVAVLVILSFSSWVNKRRKPAVCPVSQPARSADKERRDLRH
jgi:hypothetical protein